MNVINTKALLAIAEEAREASYSPYSGITVGAALLTMEGKIYKGANIEIASYTPTVCAERVAFFKAISEGESEFLAIAIAGGEADSPSKADFPPCGVCRQVMTEFCKPDFRVIWGNGEIVTAKTLGEIMPDSFDKTNL